MGFSVRLWKSEVAQWVGQALRRNKNPVFQFLQLVSIRRAARQKWYSKGAPLIIGALPALIFMGLMAHEYSLGNAPQGLLDGIKFAPLIFLVASYIVWAAIGLNTAIMDAMSLLRQSTKQSARFELDDLACVTSITDREIVAGFLCHGLPQIYLRVVAGVGLGWLIMLLIATDWLSSISNDAWTMVALAPVSIGIWSASGCIGVTALVAFYLALGGGRSTIPASMASLVVLVAQGLWLIMCYGLLEISNGNSPGNMNNKLDLVTTHASGLLTPVLLVLLVVLGLHFAFAKPVLKPVQAIGSPLLVPFLAMVLAILAIVDIDVYTGENALYILLMSFIWHFGDMLPLNFGVLSFPLFYTGDLLGWEGGTLNLWYRPITIFLAQFVLLYICLGFALRAVHDRRQAS